MASKVNRESGAVAILSVIFFMLLASVITLSFMRIVSSEKARTLDSELSDSALAAARAGVEDGKRVLEFCARTNDASAKSICAAAINSTSDDCNTITGGKLASLVPLATEKRAGSTAIEGVVDNPDGDYLQRYSCMHIDTLSKSIDDIVLNPGESQIIPLKMLARDKTTGSSASTVPNVILSWHDKSATADGDDMRAPTANVNNLQLEDWNAAKYPAAVRAQLVRVPKSGFSLDQLASDSRTVTIKPGAGSASINLSSYAPQNQPNKMAAPVANVTCTNGDDTSTPFGCKAILNLTGGYQVNNYDYYLRLTANYRMARAQLSLPDDPNIEYLFNSVQATIDVTGRTNDAFRRVRAQVRLGGAGDAFYPEYAIESATKVCKNMFVTDSANTSTDNCQYN